jgi:hypothetical protein
LFKDYNYNKDKMNTSLKWVKYNDNNDSELYTWDATIGKYGAFMYKNSNNETRTEEIELNNIGEIKECINDINYLHINDCVGISETTIDLIDDIPKGSKFGWDNKNFCWVYYLNNKVEPSYYSKKMIILL